MSLKNSGFSIPGIATALATLRDDDLAGLPHFENRHAGNRAVRVVLRRRVHDVVRAKDDHHVGFGEVRIDLVHFEDDVVGDLGLGKKHVHMARKPPGHRMDGEADGFALRPQTPRDLGYRALRLRHRHAVSGNDDDVLGVLHVGGDACHVGGDHLAFDFLAAADGGAPAARMTDRKFRFMARHMM